MIWIHVFLHALTGIQLLALALAGGGIIALGAFSAPIFFKVMDRRPAGRAMAEMFAKFDKLMAVLTWVLLITEIPYAYMVAASRFMTFDDPPRWVAFMGIPEEVKVLLILGFVALSFLRLYGINPKLNALEPVIFTEGKMDKVAYKEFQALHKQSEKLAKVQAFVALAALFISPFADI